MMDRIRKISDEKHDRPFIPTLPGMMQALRQERFEPDFRFRRIARLETAGFGLSSTTDYLCII
jgi:HD-like signal output (HDOD) protein